MSHINLIWKTKRRMFQKHLTLLLKTARIRLFLIVFFAGAFWLASFLAFHKGFVDMRTAPFIDMSGVSTIVSLFFMTLMGLLVVTSVLVAHSVFYTSRDTQFLMTFPISRRSIFIAKFVESLGYCAVALFFLGVPLMVAFGTAFDARWYFYPSIAAFFPPLMLLPCGIGVFVAAMLVRLIPRLDFKWLVVAVCLVASVWLIYLFHTFNIVELSRHVSWWHRPKPPTSHNVILSRYWPNYWITEGLIAVSRGRLRLCLRDVLRLFGLTGIVLIPTLIFVPPIFHKGFFLSAGSGTSKRFPPGSGLAGKLGPFLRMFRAPMRSLILKDLRLLWRDSTQWMQFFLFYGFMLIYIISIRNTPVLREFPVLKDRIALLNLFATALVMTTLTSRFVFPMLSTEGKKFWVIGTAPFASENILWVKFWLSLTVSMVFTIGLVVLSSTVLKVSLLLYGVSLVTIVLLNLSLVGMASGLGAIYTNLDEGDPLRVSSAMGSALTFFLSICYVLLAISAVASPFFLRGRGWYPSPSEFWLTLAAVMIFISVLSLVVAAVPMVYGLRTLRQLEVT